MVFTDPPHTLVKDHTFVFFLFWTLPLYSLYFLCSSISVPWVGCSLGGLFTWDIMFLYSDNQLAPNYKDIELGEVEQFAVDSNIVFSTYPDLNKSKSKLIFVCGL